MLYCCKSFYEHNGLQAGEYEKIEILQEEDSEKEEEHPNLIEINWRI